MAPSDQPGWRVGGEGAAALHAGPGIKGSSGRQKAQPWPALPPRESAAVPSKIFFLRHIPWGTASVPAAARVHVHTAAGRAPAMSGARPGDRCPPRGLDQQCPAQPPPPGMRGEVSLHSFNPFRLRKKLTTTECRSIPGTKLCISSPGCFYKAGYA